MPKYLIQILIAFLLPLSMFAQKVSPSKYNFGKVRNWSNPDAEVTIQNNTDRAFMFLPRGYDPNIFISVPQGEIKAGEKAVIKVKYYTREGGKFNFQVPIFINTRQDPLLLTLSGTIVSFAPDALSLCPQLYGEAPTDPSMVLNPEIEVVDASTGRPLTGVDILITGPTRSYAFEDTRKPMVKAKGIPMGLYYIDCSREGYNDLNTEKYINKSTFRIRLEMEPNGKGEKSEEILVRNVDEAIDKVPTNDASDDDMIVIENNSYEEKEAIERIRKMMDKKFRGKKIIERDVLVINEPGSGKKGLADSISDESNLNKSESEEGVIDTSDFLEDGSLNPSRYALNNIVFLIDASGSMYREDKLPLLKVSMKKLVGILRPEDRLTLIIYRSNAEVLLQGVSGDQKQRIYQAIDSIEAKGNSYGTEGLYAAYEAASYGFIKGGNNQIILASDGMFNSTDFNERGLFRMADKKAKEGVILSAIGFGNLTKAIEFMRNLSSNGKGSFLQIRNEAEAGSALVEEIKKQSVLSRD